MRYLCFDCLVIDDQNVMKRPLDKRYGVCRRIQSIRTASSARLTSPTSFAATERLVLQTIPKDASSIPSYRCPTSLPVRPVPHIRFVISRLLNAGRIVVKDTNLSYHIEKVFDIDIPALHHENDGLIYTCVSTPYTQGTDRNMYVRFPPFPPPSLSLSLSSRILVVYAT